MRWLKGYCDLTVWNRIPAILIAHSSCKELSYLITNENRREKLLRYFLHPFLNFGIECQAFYRRIMIFYSNYVIWIENLSTRNFERFILSFLPISFITSIFYLFQHFLSSSFTQMYCYEIITSIVSSSSPKHGFPVLEIKPPLKSVIFCSYFPHNMFVLNLQYSSLTSVHFTPGHNFIHFSTSSLCS
jgi:hypothetical protein